ncbi:MAG: phosphoribosylanthranilate isomerase [Desulfobacterales bacterium]|nr:phosphoribosylanthranilate isomerase [Desulfobacterales bacterium]
METVLKRATDNGHQTVQVKICGLTRPDEAVACADLGADAIGLVFYPKSPRHVDARQAGAICRAIGVRVVTVGVFVNADFDAIMETVGACGLRGVQLHGVESAELVDRLRAQGLVVIKALLANREPHLAHTSRYRPSAFLAECAGGPLPGGNAKVWDWGQAKPIGADHPLVLAGGLDPENVCEAIAAAGPAAVDVSSGVEASPGRKDPEKVRRFIEAVRACPPPTPRSDNIF